MRALDSAVIENGLARNHYDNAPDLERIAGGEVVYMNDGGYTRWVAHQYDSGGFYLSLIETGATDRKDSWGAAYELQREVARVLNTYARKAFADSAESSEGFEPVTDLQQFWHDCKRHGTPDATLEAARLLMNQGSQHGKYMVAQCNGEWPYDRTWSSDDSHPQAVRDCRHQIEEYASQVGAKSVEFGGDPRGCTVKLVWHDGATNDFGSEGWCVPGA
jgi:hypothetical protein